MTEFQAEVSRRFDKASQSRSASGLICKVAGIAMAVAAPLALGSPIHGIPVAAGMVAAGATTAAIGSSACPQPRFRASKWWP